MRPILHTVTADSSRDEVVDLVERYKIPALPVVDEENRLVGCISYEDVVEAMEDIADNTIASIAGTAEEVGEHEPTMKRLLWRAPWLLVTLCAGFVSTSVMSHFYGLNWFTFVPLFTPLITGMSGNVGIQCSTILVRWMSTGELSQGAKREAIGKEMLIGTMIGILFGFLCSLVVLALSFSGLYPLDERTLNVVLMVGFGIFAACLTATTLGTFSPFFFARFGIDPAVASGPIVTACNDVLSTLMFFLVARLVYSINII
jgi:magnesium transporter